jgi:hypothetical protein
MTSSVYPLTVFKGVLIMASPKSMAGSRCNKPLVAFDQCPVLDHEKLQIYSRR